MRKGIKKGEFNSRLPTRASYGLDAKLLGALHFGKSVYFTLKQNPSIATRLP